METTTLSITADSSMDDVLSAYPGARRALFRKYHIGGCSSCGFESGETLAQVCERNNALDVTEVLAHIQTSHELDESILIDPKSLAELREKDDSVKLLDVRTREEFDAVKIDGATMMDQEIMQEILGKWDRDGSFVIIDHEGKQALDAASFFLGHGFTNVRCLRGGIDAWALEMDRDMPRYKLG